MLESKVNERQCEGIRGMIKTVFKEKKRHEVTEVSPVKDKEGE